MESDARNSGIRDRRADIGSARIGRFGLLPSLLEDYIQRPSTLEHGLTIALDVEETPDTYVITADIPGVRKEDIVVDLYEDTLTISAERKPTGGTAGNVVWRERGFGKATRSIQLPQSVDEAEQLASYESGTLRLALAKRAVKNTRRIEIA